MAEKVTKVEKLFNKYLAKMSGLLASSEASEILAGLSNGNNRYMRIDRIESSAFDSSWIDQIEGVIFDLGDIVANPRQNTKTTSDLVPVELARKTNSESIRHLASHTQFIKEVSEGGDVVPSKILNIGNDDDIHTYENRFIATFIRKLVLFVEKRFEYISQFAPLKDEEVLMMKNHSFIDSSEIEIETKIRVKTAKEDATILKANAFLERIKKIREYVLYFYSSSFMKQMKTDRDVRNPILQTNIIRKNLKYHHCYEVYRFIEKYDSLGVNYKVDESFSEFSSKELEELNYAFLVNFLTLKAKHMSDQHKTNTKVYKPKIVTSCDDESFVYGPLLNGPITFVRVDEEYNQYLLNKVSKELPPYPTKREKEYYSEEFDNKKAIKEELEQVEKLNKRKAKEVDKYNKLFNEFVKEREAEEARIFKKIDEAVKELEEQRLNLIREQLIKEAKNDASKEETIQEAAPVEPELIEEPIKEEAPIEPVKEIAKEVPSNEEDDFKVELDEPLKPGNNYVILTPKGYYVGVNKYTDKISKARKYNDLNKLMRLAKRQHGKIIKR